MSNNLLAGIKKISKEHHIPHLRDNTLSYIQQYIDTHHVQNILEIGTAYGYSAYGMSLCKSVNMIITLEKNPENYLLAKKMLSNIPHIELNNVDAFVYQPNNIFDLILIDGPKSHQEQLVEHYLKYLNKNGTIIIDNIYLKKFSNKNVLTRNQQNILTKLESFRK
jgi:predicted O-methyltransferase YrrM